jgi:UDP-N-acetylmuramyl tripeptide synthase
MFLALQVNARALPLRQIETVESRRLGFGRMTAFPAKVAAARAAAGLSRRAGAGGGTSLPGKLLLRMAPDAIARLAGRLPDGVVALSATNGKTTTAKMLAAMLEPERRLCRNAAGANLASGVASALVASNDAELGVFEVDEAALEDVAPALAPRVLGLGNLFRDQLDRYGELELVAARWRRISAAGPWRLVKNADDPLVAGLPAGDGSLTYGIDDPGVALPELPHAADSKWCAVCGERLRYDAVYLGHLGAWACPACGNARPALDVAATSVVFDGLDGTDIALRTPLGERRVRMPLPGLYNVYNALAAVAMACALGDVTLERMAAGLEVFGPAFGRFERVTVDGHEAVLVLSKNPAGANEVIRTLAHDPAPKRLVVALNDRIADGRDVSWIWDVDFELLAGGVESVVTSGTRAAEMAVRLKYAGIDPGLVQVEPDLAAALDAAVAAGQGPAYVLTTYTAMLELRGALTRRGVVPPYWEAA